MIKYFDKFYLQKLFQADFKGQSAPQAKGFPTSISTLQNESGPRNATPGV